MHFCQSNSFPFFVVSHVLWVMWKVATIKNEMKECVVFVKLKKNKNKCCIQTLMFWNFIFLRLNAVCSTDLKLWECACVASDDTFTLVFEFMTLHTLVDACCLKQWWAVQVRTGKYIGSSSTAYSYPGKRIRLLLYFFSYF
jgi:hypothetical protein